METIPGETPIDDFSQLKVKGITLRKELNAYEAENIRKPITKYLTVKPTPQAARFDLSWCKKLHKEMFSDVWGWAGDFRTRDLTIGISAQHIETSLYDLMENLKVWKESGMLMVEQATLLHHRAVQIHPFLNGNGRWSRLLANIWLKRHGESIILWPEESVGHVSVIRDAYIAAIKQADQGNFEPLLALHRQFQENSHPPAN
jgi:Fic-DOC domain mobile mystery protein B